MNGGQTLLSGFDPRTIPGCDLWLDAADARTLTLTSGNVSAWLDKSSNGLTFSNTASRGPTRTATLNGLDVLTFTATSSSDAAGQYLDASISFNFVTHSLFLVHRPALTSGSSYGNTNAIAVQSNVNAIAFPHSDGTGQRGYSNALYTIPYATNDVSTAYNLTAATLTYTRLSVTRNGRQQSYAYSGVGTTDVSGDSSIRIGARPGATPSNFYSGTIAEVIAYERGLTEPERIDVEGYLAWKWGLQGNLPTTLHYASNAPYQRPLLPTDVNDCIVWFDAADPATLVTSGTTVTTWRSKGVLDLSASGSVGTISTGYTFTTSPLNAIQFPGGSYFTVSNVTHTTAARTQFFIFTVTSYGDGYGRIFASATELSNHQSGFNSWNRDGNNILMFPFALSGTEVIVASGQSPYSGTLPYDGTPFVIGIRHTGARASNATALPGVISINGKVVALASLLPLSNGYFIGNTAFRLGTGAAYANVQRIGEVIQYDRALTDPEMRRIEGYLCRKWNVSFADTAHPFVSIPPAVSVAFVPSIFGSCLLWMDAADTTTLTTSGSSVTSWRDKSGQGNTITFATSPTTGTVTRNGNNVLVYSSTRGSNARCKIAVGQHTLIAVHSPTNGTTANTNLFRFWDGTGAGNRVVFPYYTTSNAGWSAVDGVNSIGNQPDGSPGGGVYSLIIASVGSQIWPFTYTTQTSLEIFRDGTRVRSSNQSLATSSLAGTFWTGATSTGTDFYSGNVCELLVYGSKLRREELRLVEGYLAKKWGL